MSRQFITQGFNKGIHNKLDPELIPKEAAVDSKNWATREYGIELSRGIRLVNSAGVAGSGVNENWAYKANGDKLHYRQVKIGDNYIVQYDNGTEWVNVIENMKHECSFTNYSSIGGVFMFIGSQDGLFMILTANPTDYIDMTDSQVNFKGKIFIDRGRMILWDRETDGTGLYGSKIDPQDGSVLNIKGQDLGDGTGSKEQFSDTLVRKPFDYISGVNVVGRTGSERTISSISKEQIATVAFSQAHLLTVGDIVQFKDVVGMTEINGLTAEVLERISTSVVKVKLNTTEYTSYTSGGLAYEVEKFTDDFSGTLSSNKDGTGTINYTTGLVEVNFQTAPRDDSVVKVVYQTQDHNKDGITDFTSSATRIAGEGFILRQDVGGDAIQNVLILDGSYFSIKENSIYRVSLSQDDNPSGVVNEVFRRNTGIKYWQSAVTTSKGIIYMDSFDGRSPKLSLLSRGAFGDVFDSKEFAEHFEYSNYIWDKSVMVVSNENIIVSCKENGSTYNNLLLVINLTENRIDKYDYRTGSISNSDGQLYITDSLSVSTYKVFSGFSNNGKQIENYWTGKEELMETERLKKTRFIRIKGDISLNVELDIYVSYDNLDRELIGTLKGNSNFVNLSKVKTIGDSLVGEDTIGGNSETFTIGIETAPYFAEFKLKQKKFNKRQITFVARNGGYVSVEKVIDEDILYYQNRMPRNRRIKPIVTYFETKKVLDELLETLDYYKKNNVI